MIKIFIVEDQTMFRDTLEYMINGQEDMEVIGTTDDAAEALDLCRKLNPDLVLMDVVTKRTSNGPPSNGIRYSAEIRKELPDIKIVIMTGYPEITFAEEARKAGAHSFLQKSMDKEHLLYVIHSTMKGVGFYPGPFDSSPFAGKFSETEVLVIRLVCQGLEREEIAEKLSVSEATVKKLIKGVLDITGFDSIAKFAIFAVGKGYIVPEIS